MAKTVANGHMIFSLTGNSTKTPQPGPSGLGKQICDVFPGNHPAGTCQDGNCNLQIVCLYLGKNRFLILLPRKSFELHFRFQNTFLRVFGDNY